MNDFHKSSVYNTARERVKSLLKVWKGKQFIEEAAKYHRIDAQEIARWSKVAHAGMLDALAQDYAFRIAIRSEEKKQAVKLPKEKTCCVCGTKATWVRHTQFAGDHPFCDEHAEKEKDFKKNNSYQHWDRMKARK